MKVKLIAIIICLCSFNTSYAVNPGLDGLTILVPSCDKYHGLWDPFFHALFANWPSLATQNLGLPIKLIANNSKYSNPRIKTINIRHEKSWSDNLLTALQKVDTPYVMLILEDYILTKQVDEQSLIEVYQYLRNNNGAYIQFSGGINQQTQTTEPTKHPKITKFAKHSKYRTSLQLAIWNKQDLQWLLRPGESAIDFEVAGSTRSEGLKKPFFAYPDTNTESISYLNAAHRGLICEHAIKYFNAHNIPFDAKNQPLPLESDRKLLVWKNNILNKIKKYNFVRKIYYKFQKFTKSLVSSS